ncbi:hypothetical protein V9T40_005712 [Parthenolecanium corni]|uniref:Uncharacterized protein n=1 Tax=Parthenolecanium corni TaxID=536013 RepID=A0AAN9TUP3_9HEMI
MSCMTPLKILRWTSQRTNILRTPDLCHTTPPGPLSNRVKPGISSVERRIQRQEVSLQSLSQKLRSTSATGRHGELSSNRFSFGSIWNNLFWGCVHKQSQIRFSVKRESRFTGKCNKQPNAETTVPRKEPWEPPNQQLAAWQARTLATE